MRTLQQLASIAALTDKDIEAIVAMACNSSTAMPSIWGVRRRAHACSCSVTMSQSWQCHTGHMRHTTKGHMICKSAILCFHRTSEVPQTVFQGVNWDILRFVL